MILLDGAIFAVLLFIAWQDFKFRAVYWWLFVLLLAGLATKQSLVIGLGQVGDNVMYNGIFLLLQLLCLTAYFSLRERRLVSIFKGYFGLGDLFFLLGITVYFSFFGFVFFYGISLVLVILATLMIGLLRKHNSENQKIPLAGYQAIFLLFFMVSSYLIGIEWGADQWLSNYINL